MAAALLALLAALSYGTSDFVGGVLSRTRSAWAVAASSHMTAAVVTALFALIALGHPGPGDFAWAAAAGVGEGIGISFLFRGLSCGQMGIVAPISGTGAAIVPVLVGVATGDQLSLLVCVGIAIAFPAVLLISQQDGRHKPATSGTRASTGAVYGVIAGLGFGAQLALVGQIGDAAGLLPLAVLWLSSATTVVTIAIALGQPWRPRGGGLRPVFIVGLLSAAAVMLFLLATRQGLLAIVSVITALYPASTVAMAGLVLHERIGRLQSVGLVLAVGAVILVTLG